MGAPQAAFANYQTVGSLFDVGAHELQGLAGLGNAIAFLVPADFGVCQYGLPFGERSDYRKQHKLIDKVVAVDLHTGQATGPGD